MTADVAEAEGLHQLKLSGTKFRKMLRAGEDIPEWCECAHLPCTSVCCARGSPAIGSAGLLLRGLVLVVQVRLQVRGGRAAEGDNLGQPHLPHRPCCCSLRGVS